MLLIAETVVLTIATQEGWVCLGTQLEGAAHHDGDGVVAGAWIHELSWGRKSFLVLIQYKSQPMARYYHNYGGSTYLNLPNPETP